MDNKFLTAAVAIALIGLTACSSSEPAKTVETKPADESAKKADSGPPMPVLAKDAFYEMYTLAHMWAADILPLSLESAEVTGIKNEDGKAGAWKAVFVSPAMHQARSYSYSVVDQLPTFAKGVKADSPVPWGGPTAGAAPFQTTDFTIDSDAAYKTAAEKAGTWPKEHPDKPLTMALGYATRFPSPVWYYLWGTSKDGFAVYISATSGSIITR
jgi:hypothetical protein